MKTLVVFGSKRGGTAEIAMTIAQALREAGHEVVCERASAIGDVRPYQAVIVGGALYMGRWMHEVRHFVARHADALRVRPVWMFSSGPLDPSASTSELAATSSVAALMKKVGARGHVTFGGRLKPDAHGFPASAMAKKSAGDWRDFERIRTWARGVGDELAAMGPIAIPETGHPHASRGLLTALCLLTGITAVGGGTALVAAPDGSYVGLPLSTLQYSPFSSFLIPGLLLLIVVGLGNVVAGVMVAREMRGANHVAFAAGLALGVFIVTEMILLRTVVAFHGAYLIAALLILTEAVWRWRVDRRYEEAPRTSPANAVSFE